MKSKARGIILILLIITLGCVSVNRNEPLNALSDEALPIVSSIEKTDVDPLVLVLSFDYEDLGIDTGTKNLPIIFKILEKHDASATFFILGRTAENNPDSIKDIYSRGYSIGLHTTIHHFPIFSRESALVIEDVYNTTSSYVWDRSFKTTGAFMDDLEINRKSVKDAVGNDVELNMFRSPSLVVNWSRNPEYFSSLKMANIEIDSSVFRELGDNKPFYLLYGVVEVPVTVSETSLSDLENLNRISEEYSKEGLPLVMYIHPQKLGSNDLIIFDEFLSSLEEEYDVTYLMVDEVPTYYGTS
ncbi:MAG: polysaccharide deacetylase family protein [Thermodesulfobacteriota bacterium]